MNRRYYTNYDKQREEFKQTLIDTLMTAYEYGQTEIIIEPINYVGLFNQFYEPEVSLSLMEMRRSKDIKFTIEKAYSKYYGSEISRTTYKVRMSPQTHAYLTTSEYYKIKYN